MLSPSVTLRVPPSSQRKANIGVGFADILAFYSSCLPFTYSLGVMPVVFLKILEK